jgi:hypothetical protein
MSLYPLYDQIVDRMDGTETVLSKYHCTTIARLDQEHLNIIYLIILHYYINSNPGNYNIPYGGKTVANGKGVSYRKLSQIPDEVQKIIYRYLEIVSK